MNVIGLTHKGIYDYTLHTVLYQIEQLGYIIAFFTSDVYGLIMATLYPKHVAAIYNRWSKAYVDGLY